MTPRPAPAVLGLLAVLAAPLPAADVVGVHLVRTIDGDTAVFEVAGAPRRVRFRDVDTPELRARCAWEATAAAAAARYTGAALLEAHEIELRDYAPGADVWGRDLAAIWVDGRDLAAELIGAGLGRPMGVRRAGWCR